MRTKNSLKNVSVSFINNIILNILRFVSRTIFIKVIGDLYLGVNGLLSNVLGVLALADLGIGTAISFSLYEPLARGDKEKIKSLMRFYKKSYFIIGLVIMIAGLGLLPFLDFFIKDNNIDNMFIYYLIFLANMVISYWFSYKRTLMSADQKEYKLTYIDMIFNFISTILQIIAIIVFENYTIYLLVQTLTLLVNKILVNRYVDKNYPYIKDNNIDSLDKEEYKSITKNVKALMFHKLGSYFVDSTDNIIISKYLGLITVGLYSNYYLIISMVNKFVNGSLWSIVASIGNLNVSEGPTKRFEVYKKLNFIGFFVFCICTICFLNLFNLFIGKIWIGEQYLFSMDIVLVICLNFYISGMMHVNDAVKSSAGLYDKDKYVPIIQSIVNIIVSVILVNKIGIIGVFLGTICSSLVPTIIKPFIIYKNLFDVSAIHYFKEYIKQLLILLVSGSITIIILNNIVLDNLIIQFIIYAFISTIIPLVLIIIVYFNTNTLKDIVYSFKKVINKD